MIKDASNMVLRYYIGFENTEKRFKQLVNFLNSTGIHRVILFSSTFLEESAIIPLEYYKSHAELLRPYVEELKGMGIETGINVLNTVGHAYYADEEEFGFRRAITVHGEKSRGCVCFRDEKLIEFIKKEYKYYASLNPSVIFTDDDIRAISLGQMICLCPEHIRLISKRVGKELTFEEIREHILNSSFEKDVIKEAFFEQMREDVENIISIIADAVHEISSNTEIGIMTTTYPSITLDRDLHKFFDSFYTDKKVTRIRTGMNFYREGEHKEIPLMFSMPLIQRELLQNNIVEIQPEVENDTYGFYNKSNSVTSMQLVWCLTNGLRNMQLNLFDIIDCPACNYIEIKDMFCKNMPYFNKITELIPVNHRTDGINIYVNPNSLLARRTKNKDLIFQSNWHKWLNLVGIPLSSDISKANCVFLTGDDIVMAADDEIDNILKKGVLMDLRAAEALVYRGYGKRIGIESINKMDEPFAGERFTDHALNSPYQNHHNSYYFVSSLFDKDLVAKIKYADGADVLSKIVNHRKEIICNGITIYENEQNERFCIMPTDNNEFSLFTNVNNKRKKQFINVFEWLSKKKLPVYAVNENVCININCLEKQNIITIFNLTSDEISTPKINYNINGKMKYLDSKGKIKKLKYKIKDGNILLMQPIKAFGVLIIVDEKE